MGGDDILQETLYLVRSNSPRRVKHAHKQNFSAMQPFLLPEHKIEPFPRSVFRPPHILPWPALTVEASMITSVGAMNASVGAMNSSDGDTKRWQTWRDHRLHPGGLGDAFPASPAIGRRQLPPLEMAPSAHAHSRKALHPHSVTPLASLHGLVEGAPRAIASAASSPNSSRMKLSPTKSVRRQSSSRPSPIENPPVVAPHPWARHCIGLTFCRGDPRRRIIQ